jgi:formylglycine-generating enzyme required for sulfatase activity
MSGNVWEWTCSLYGEVEPENKMELITEFGYPYVVQDQREDLSASENWTRVLRGGSWNSSKKFERCAARAYNLPSIKNDFYGFRVCIRFPYDMEDTSR